MRAKVLAVSIIIAILGAVSFITDLSSEMIMPLLPFFITAPGGAGVAIGLIHLLSSGGKPAIS